MTQQREDVRNPPWGLKWRSNTFFIITIVGIGLFSDLFLYGLVVPILPFILTERLHLPHDQVQQNVSSLLAAYAAASVLFSPVAGLLADKLPTRRAPFLIGLAVMLLSTTLFLAGSSVPMLLVARILQGVSAATVWTVGLVLSLDTVGPENLGKTIGSMSSFVSVGPLVAPVLGGVIYKKSGYTGVFVLAFGVLGIDFVMRLLLVEKKAARKFIAEESDGEAGGAAEDEEASEEQALIQGQVQESYKIEADESMVTRVFPFAQCLRDPRVLAAQLVSLSSALLAGSFDATLPTIAEEYFGYDLMQAGLLFIALILPDLLLGPVGGWFVDRYGSKLAAVSGFLFLTPVLVLFRLVKPGDDTSIVIWCVLLALSGVGFAMIGSPAYVDGAYVAQLYERANPGLFGANGPYAQLYGFNSMMYSAGLALGPIISGTLKQSYGYGNMNAVLAGISVFTAFTSFLYVGGKPKLFHSSQKRVSD